MTILKNESTPYLTPKTENCPPTSYQTQEINFRLNIDLNVKGKIIKFLKEKLGEYIRYISPKFLKQKLLVIKEKTNKLPFIILRIFAHQKIQLREREGKPQTEKIFVKYIYLYPEYIKNFYFQ